MKNIVNILFDSHSLLGKLLCSLLYCLVYDFMFNHFVYHYFSYMNIDYIEMDSQQYILWLILSIVPFLSYKGVEEISSFFVFFLYLFVYIPFIHTLFVISGINSSTASCYALIMFMFFILYFKTGTNWCIFKNLIIQPSISVRVIEIITIILTVIFIIARYSTLHFVNIFTQSDLMYELRAENAQNYEGLEIINYIKGWLFGAFYPFLLVCFLKQKKRISSICILFCYLILFMEDMQKLTFFMPFFMIVFYFFIRVKEKVFSHKMHTFIIYFIIIVSIILFALKDNTLGFIVGSMFFLRTTCVAGWLSQFYLHFFVDNPYTYYSHINIINAFTDEYPYNVPLGVAVSYGSQNANANFFLTDGLAAGGIIGVIIIGIIFLILLHFMNAISYRYKKADLLIIFLPTLSYVLNTSLFTTMLSNGLLALILLLISSESPLNDTKTEETDTTKSGTVNEKKLQE